MSDQIDDELPSPNAPGFAVQCLEDFKARRRASLARVYAAAHSIGRFLDLERLDGITVATEL